jgi:hypothetical protein
MKRMIGIAVALVVVLAVIRRFGPALRNRARAKCQEMFDRVPEDSPLKRLLQNLEELGEQNTRILRHLEQQDVLLAAGEAR